MEIVFYILIIILINILSTFIFLLIYKRIKKNKQKRVQGEYILKLLELDNLNNIESDKYLLKMFSNGDIEIINENNNICVYTKHYYMGEFIDDNLLNAFNFFWQLTNSGD